MPSRGRVLRVGMKVVHHRMSRRTRIDAISMKVTLLDRSNNVVTAVVAG